MMGQRQSPACRSVNGDLMNTTFRHVHHRIFDHSVQTPLSELHQTLLERAEELGFGGADNSAIIQAFKPS